MPWFPIGVGERTFPWRAVYPRRLPRDYWKQKVARDRSHVPKHGNTQFDAIPSCRPLSREPKWKHTDTNPVWSGADTGTSRKVWLHKVSKAHYSVVFGYKLICFENNYKEAFRSMTKSSPVPSLQATNVHFPPFPRLFWLSSYFHHLLLPRSFSSSLNY